MLAPRLRLHDCRSAATGGRRPNALAGWFLACACIASAHVHAAPVRYEIDPVHTRVWFEAGHAGFSKALGTFSRTQGAIWFDADEPSRSTVEVELSVDTLDLGDAEWNERLARKDFLWSAEHPVARFRSTRVERAGAQALRVHGVLSVRDAEVDVVLDATLNRAARHPLTLRRTIGFSGQATLSRAAFGMTSWKRLVADEVLLRVEVEARRKRGDGPDDDGDEASEDGPAQTDTTENRPALDQTAADASVTDPSATDESVASPSVGDTVNVDATKAVRADDPSPRNTNGPDAQTGNGTPVSAVRTGDEPPSPEPEDHP